MTKAAIKLIAEIVLVLAVLAVAMIWLIQTTGSFSIADLLKLGTSLNPAQPTSPTICQPKYPSEMVECDASDLPDLVFSAVKNNKWQFKVCKNLDSNGDFESCSDIDCSILQGCVGGPGDSNVGGGAAIGDIDKDGVPDIILTTVDQPSGSDFIRYKVGLSLGVNGAAGRWIPDNGNGFKTVKDSVGGGDLRLGDCTRGGGVAMADIDGQNDKPDVMFMWVDDTSNWLCGGFGNTDEIWYKIGFDLDFTNGEFGGWYPAAGLAKIKDLGYVGDNIGTTTNGAGVDIKNWTDTSGNRHVYVLFMVIETLYVNPSILRYNLAELRPDGSIDIGTGWPWSNSQFREISVSQGTSWGGAAMRNFSQTSSPWSNPYGAVFLADKSDTDALWDYIISKDLGQTNVILGKNVAGIAGGEGLG